MKKKRIYTEEQKAYQAKYYQKNKEKKKISHANWYQENKEQRRIYNAEFRKANPGYKKEWDSQHDLGYWVVYLIHNFDGLNNIYCGQTANIYSRMASHKSKGTLNSDKHELIKQCETLEDAKSFEAYMHKQGYHGYNNGI